MEGPEGRDMGGWPPTVDKEGREENKQARDGHKGSHPLRIASAKSETRPVARRVGAETDAPAPGVGGNVSAQPPAEGPGEHAPAWSGSEIGEVPARCLGRWCKSKAVPGSPKSVPVVTGWGGEFAEHRLLWALGRGHRDWGATGDRDWDERSHLGILLGGRTRPLLPDTH